MFLKLQEFLWAFLLGTDTFPSWPMDDGLRSETSEGRGSLEPTG